MGRRCLAVTVTLLTDSNGTVLIHFAVTVSDRLRIQAELFIYVTNGLIATLQSVPSSSYKP